MSSSCSRVAGIAILIVCSAAIAEQRPEIPDAWHQRHIVEAYERHGSRSEQWDRQALNALSAMARRWTREHTPTHDEIDIIWVMAGRALELGCVDPLVMYLRASNMEHFRVHAEERRKLFIESAEAILETQYHPVLKWHALIDAARNLAQDEGNPQAKEQAKRMLNVAVELAPQVAADHEIPRRRMVEAFKAMGVASLQVEGDRLAVFHRVMPAFADHPDQSLLLAIAGELGVTYAWDARGRGWASTVTEEGWDLMRQRLEVAEQAATRAWEMDNSNVYACLAMLTVELGQGQGRRRMELWYRRAMEADPNSYEACRSKRHYLEPKWHGSHQDMIRFGRQLLRDGNWNAQLPLILVATHTELSRYAPDGYKSRPHPWYFKDNAAAWRDISAVFEEYLERVPESRYYRSWYAQLACWSEQWEVAAKQFDRLGERYSYQIFRQKEDFESLRAQAYAAVGKDRPAAGEVAD